MTRFLTEDKSDSPFVKLFNAAYPKAVLECTGRNSKLPYRARKLAESGDQVVVYLDMVPDNGALKVIYDKLFALHDDDLDVVVIPIVCAEYAFICSVANLSGPIYDRSGLSDVIGKSSSYRSSALADKYFSKIPGESAEEEEKRRKEWPRNFEKFCKLFCEKCMNHTCCLTAGGSGASAGKPYFSCDCGTVSPANPTCTSCSTRLTMVQKSTLYLQQFPIIPSGGSAPFVVVSWSDVIQQSRQYADAYNTWGRTFCDGFEELPKL